MSLENSNKPKFKFKEYISEKADCIGGSYQFDCYTDKNGEVILIMIYFDIDRPGDRIHHILLIALKDNKVIKKLEDHKDRVLIIRYFQEPKSKKDYLISADRFQTVIVWDLNDFCKIFEIQMNYYSFIYSSLLISYSNNIYAVISTLGEGSTKIFNLKDKSKFIDINNTKNLSVYYLTYWYNKKSNQLIIIQCGKKIILMTEFPNNIVYDILNSDEKYQYNISGLVFTNEERNLLAVSATYGLIIIYDLEQKKIMLKIMIDNVFLYNFIKWNDNYLFVLDSLNKKIINFNIKDNEFKHEDEIELPELYYDRFIKKVNHPIYGESLITVGIDWKIKLFVIPKNS